MNHKHRHLKYSFVIHIMNLCNKQHSLSLDYPTLDDDISVMEAIYKDRNALLVENEMQLAYILYA